MKKIAISVPEAVLSEVDRAAKRRGVTRSRFISEVLAKVAAARSDAEIRRRVNAIFSDAARRSAMVIRQGDVVWVVLPVPRGSEPGGRRPTVILRHDRFNQTVLNTVVVAMITSNLRLAALPGNVRLRKGEAALPRASVVNVTQVATLDRDDVTARVGSLSRARLREIWAGLRLVLEPDL